MTSRICAGCASAPTPFRFETAPWSTLEDRRSMDAAITGLVSTL